MKSVLPVRRRTYFGNTSERQLKIIIGESRASDSLIENAESKEHVVPIDLHNTNAKERELRMAAQAELSRRNERKYGG